MSVIFVIFLSLCTQLTLTYTLGSLKLVKKISIRVKNGYTKHFLNWLLYYYVQAVPIQYHSKPHCCILTLTNFKNLSLINVPQTLNDVFTGSWWDLQRSDLAAQLLRVVVVVVVGLLYVVLLYITIFRKINPVLKKGSLYIQLLTAENWQ